MADDLAGFVDPSRPARFLADYRAGSWRRGAEPSPFFNSRWYVLEHPDWLHFPSPFDHYLARGLDSNAAPSPFVDSVQLARTWPDLDARDRFRKLVAEGAGIEAGVLSSASDLAYHQNELLAKIDPVLLRTDVRTKQRHLVLLQNDRSEQAEAWTAHEDRSFDLLVNHYVDRQEPSGLGDVEVSQIGTKFSAVHVLAARWPELLLGYRWILLIDDDITIGPSDLDRLFVAATERDAALAQATLDSESTTSWPDLKLQPGEVPSAVAITTAEIMMPVMRSDFFWRAVRYMSKSISGYGLDAVWADMLRDTGESAWRLPVVARHERVVDQESGPYYEFLRSHHLNPHAERWVLEQALGLSRGIVTVTTPAGN